VAKALAILTRWAHTAGTAALRLRWQGACPGPPATGICGCALLTVPCSLGGPSRHAREDHVFFKAISHGIRPVVLEHYAGSPGRPGRHFLAVEDDGAARRVSSRPVAFKMVGLAAAGMADDADEFRPLARAGSWTSSNTSTSPPRGGEGLLQAADLAGTCGSGECC